MNRYTASVFAFVVFLLSACAVIPRTSTWEGHSRFTKSDVYQAALQAGAENGWQTTASDRDSGTMSFSKPVGRGVMILGVSITKPKDRIIVRTTANYGGDIAIYGMHEEFIRNFHRALFRKLDIADASERIIDIQEGH